MARSFYCGAPLLLCSLPLTMMTMTTTMIRTAQPIFLTRRRIPLVLAATKTTTRLGQSTLWARNACQLNLTSSLGGIKKSKIIASCHSNINNISPGTNLRFQIGRMHPPLYHAFSVIRIFSSQQGGSPRSRLVSSLGMIGAGGMLLLGKGKYLVGALKLTKFASLGSMLVTVGAYTAFCE